MLTGYPCHIAQGNKNRTSPPQPGYFSLTRFFMVSHIILASGSAVRARLLRNAGISFATRTPRIDEGAVKTALLAENARTRDIADTLAEMKARKISEKERDALVIGSDQVLEFRGELVSKPTSREDALLRLSAMRGHAHRLFSAAVVCENGVPVWRHIGQVRMYMRGVSDRYLAEYVERNWDSIRHCAGGYKLEEEGVRLFTGIDGDYFNVLGMPVFEVLNFLAVRGVIEQ